MKNKLRRGTHDRWILGVCRGFANYFDIDVAIIRIIWVISLLFGGVGLVLYLLLAVIIPKDNYIEYK